MTTQRLALTRTHPLGSLGLLLLLLVAKLSESAYTSTRAARGGMRAFLARRAIDGIAAVGWTADRLGGRPAASSRGTAGRRVARPV